MMFSVACILTRHVCSNFGSLGTLSVFSAVICNSYLALLIYRGCSVAKAAFIGQSALFSPNRYPCARFISSCVYEPRVAHLVAEVRAVQLHSCAFRGTRGRVMVSSRSSNYTCMLHRILLCGSSYHT